MEIPINSDVNRRKHSIDNNVLNIHYWYSIKDKNMCIINRKNPHILSEFGVTETLRKTRPPPLKKKGVDKFFRNILEKIERISFAGHF